VSNGRSTRQDAGFALAMIAVGALTMWGLRNQPRAPFDPVGAAAIPFWTAAAVIVLAVVLLAGVVMRKSMRGDATSYFVSTEAIDESYAVRPALSVVAIAATIGFIAAIPALGFRYASIGFMLVLGWQLSDRTPRALAVVAAVAFVAGIGLDAGFRAMMVSLP
jgi:hypothetical protein